MFVWLQSATVYRETTTQQSTTEHVRTRVTAEHTLRPFAAARCTAHFLNVGCCAKSVAYPATTPLYLDHFAMQPTYPSHDHPVDAPAPEPENARWRCAAVASLVLHLIAAVLLVVGLPLDDVMNAVGNGFTVRIGYFSAELCTGGTCLRHVTTDTLTCGHAAGIKAGAAFHIIALVAAVAVVASNSWELAKGADAFPHATTVAQILAACSALAGNLALAVVRDRAKYDIQSCPQTLPGIERFGVGATWYLGLILGFIVIGVAVITYVARRGCECCGCCCPYEEPRHGAPPPVADVEMVQVQPHTIVAVQAQPLHDPTVQPAQEPYGQSPPLQQPKTAA